MLQILRKLRVPASESMMGIALALCAVTMSSMLCMIVWQSDVIARQGEVIQWLRALKFGS